MDNNHGSLSVSIKELSTIHVAFINYIPKPEPGNMHREISECFQRLQGLVDNLGLDHQSLLHVGVPILRNAQLLRYECCVEVPDPIHTGADAIGIKDLPGGLFAILAIEKEPEIIGKSLELFYKEYIPQKCSIWMKNGQFMKSIMRRPWNIVFQSLIHTTDLLIMGMPI